MLHHVGDCAETYKRKITGFCTLLGPQKSEKFACTGGYEEYKYPSNKKKILKRWGAFGSIECISTHHVSESLAVLLEEHLPCYCYVQIH